MAKRRGRGEGSISLRVDGRWMARIDLGVVAGKRRRKTVYGATRASARDAMEDAHQRAKAGVLVSDERLTVGQFLTRWLRDVAKPRVRASTYATYEAAVRRHITPYVGSVPLARLTAARAQAWLTDLQRAGVSAPRQRYARVVLRTALQTALRWRLVRDNVAKLIDVPRHIVREIRSLEVDEARALLTAVEHHPLRGFVHVALGCGLRLGEALGLKWSDVDLQAGTITVRRALQRTGGDPALRRPLLDRRRHLLHLVKDDDPTTRATARAELLEVRKRLKAQRTAVGEVEPKSRQSRRTIDLPAVTLTALQAHRAQQLEQRLAAGKAWRATGHVFTTAIGSPWDPANVHKQFKQLLRGAGLPSIRIHDLRHSFASILLARGVDARTLMEMLGHSQITLTLNTYAHVLRSVQREAAKKLDAALS